MKHIWTIRPRGKKSKYYICKKCGLQVVATSIKIADELEPYCVYKKKGEVI